MKKTPGMYCCESQPVASSVGIVISQSQFNLLKSVSESDRGPGIPGLDKNAMQSFSRATVGGRWFTKITRWNLKWLVLSAMGELFRKYCFDKR